MNDKGAVKSEGFGISDADIKIYAAGCEQIKIGCSEEDDIIIYDQEVNEPSGLVVVPYGNISDYDIITVLNHKFLFYNGFLYTLSEGITVNSEQLSIYPVESNENQFKYPKFNRSTRIEYMLPDEEINILYPEKKPSPPTGQLIASIIPALAMIVLTIVIRGILAGGSMFIYYSIGINTVGISMSIYNYRRNKKRYEDNLNERITKYYTYLNEKEKKICEVLNTETGIRNITDLSPSKNIEDVINFDRRLFEKSIDDNDFLNIYLGAGTCIPHYKITTSSKDELCLDDDLMELPERLKATYDHVDDVPVTVNLKQFPVLGIIGNRYRLYDILKNLTVSLAATHYYEELKMFYILPKDNYSNFYWIKWIKNVYNEHLDIRNIACDEESTIIILEYLYNILSERDELAKKEGITGFTPHLVIFIYDMSEFLKHPVARFIASCENLGVSLVFFSEYLETLPKGCHNIVELRTSVYEGKIIETKNASEERKFSYMPVSDEDIWNMSLHLAPVYMDNINIDNALPSKISLYELLNIKDISELLLSFRWSNSKVYESMAAPIGVKRKNETVYLDISDNAKGHGPHGLVAGTTGSGKSEILQTYILSMASLFNPYDVGFVIIDFKGGGMTNQFKGLPHLLGTITNIDGHEIDRSLRSIKAELIKRQEIFSLAHVNHINDYIKLFKAGKVRRPLPHLIMIVDEFAQLKSEYPDFMKEIIATARIGRTLGIHLILATQKPAGVVDNQIWSNSKFKLCLKVQTKADSNEVLKTPLAAEIVDPGRAYFQVGNNEVFELFQSAYSGEKVYDSQEEYTKYNIYSLNFWGKKTVIYSNEREQSSIKACTQLDVMVDYIADYCKKHDIKKLDGICKPPLKNMIYVSDLGTPEKDLLHGITVTAGTYDDPDRQIQSDYVIDITSDNTIIAGASQTGKTTLLKTIIYQSLLNYSASELNFYIMDCGNMTLKLFEKSKLVGDVVLPSETEKTKNLFKMLLEQIKERKKTFAKEGLGTYRTYLEAGFKNYPYIVLIIDNLALFKEYHPDYFEALVQISREGQGVGISMIITASQVSTIGYKLIPNFGTRIMFTCNDKSEYSALFGRSTVKPLEIPGRAICMVNKSIVEFQTALCTEADREIDRINIINNVIEEKNRLDTAKAKPVPIVPEIVEFRHLDYENHNYNMPVGIRYADISYSYINFNNQTGLVISGREKSGKTNIIKALLHILEERKEIYPYSIDVIDDEESNLEFTKKLDSLTAYTIKLDEGQELVLKAYEELKQRQQQVYDKAITLEQLPLKLLLIENRQFITKFDKDADVLSALTKIIKELKRYRIAVIFTNVPNETIAYTSNNILKLLKENKKFMVFEDMQNIKIFETNTKMLKEYQRPVEKGDCYYYADGRINLIKTVYAE